MSRSRYSSDRYAEDAYERGGRRNEQPRRPAGGGNKGGPGGPGGTGPFQFNVGTLAILAGVLVVGITKNNWQYKICTLLLTCV